LKRLKDDNKLEQSEECLNTIIEYFLPICKEKVVEEDGDLDIMIEWIYRIDLDQLVLIVENWNKKETFNLTFDRDAIFNEMCKMGH